MIFIGLIFLSSEHEHLFQFSSRFLVASMADMSLLIEISN